MIEINLLPEELKKKKKTFQMPDITMAVLPISMGIMALLVLSHIALAAITNIKKNAYEKISREWEEVKLQKASVELANSENKKMKMRVDDIRTLMSKKILWSKKLNQLSDIVIKGVWFTKLSIDRKSETPYLSIEGEVSSAYGEELAIIGKFIEQLKSDTEFFRDFSNIEISSTGLHLIGDTEVMKFNIDCYFKRAEG